MAFDGVVRDGSVPTAQIQFVRAVECSVLLLANLSGVINENLHQTTVSYASHTNSYHY
jgi:hypothetical protein